MSEKSIFDMFDDLAKDWPTYSDKLISYRLSPFLNHEIHCDVAGVGSIAMFPTAEALEIRRATPTRPEATVRMSEKDWRAVLKGDLGIISIVFAGRCSYPKHERYIISKMSIILQSLATMRRTGQ